MTAPTILLVGIDPTAERLVRGGARLAGDVPVDFAAVGEREALAVAAIDPPAAAVVSDTVEEPIRIAQGLAGVDRDMSITILCQRDREAELRESLRFAPLVSTNTSCRAAGDLQQLGVDLVEAADAAVRRRRHRLSVAVAAGALAEAPSAGPARGEALGRLVEAAPIGIVALGPRGTVVAWNPYAAHVIGAPEREVLGRPVHELFDPEEATTVAALLGEAVRPRPERHPVVLRRMRQGVEQWVEVVAGPAVSQAGEPGTLLVLSDVTGRVLGERARQRAQQAQAFLAETGALLDAPLDPMEVLQRIASLAVPARAELCLIDVLTEDGQIDGVAFAAVDDDVARAVQDIRRRYPVDPRGSHPVARVLRSGVAERLEEMTEATYRRIAQSQEHLALMRRLHYHSALVAPLAARGRTHGAISLLYLDPDRQYSPDDLRVLEDVARRAALALDNARLYARERRIAETLQRSLLPSRLPEVPGVSLAAHYGPGEGDVGGDWYDVIPLPDGRLGCVVGDIVGRGIQAASVMGQLRNAVRVYALERSTAGEVVDAVDRLSESLSMGDMATLTYLILDPVRGEVELCSAGHPPPLVVAPDGSTRFLMGGRSGPVGVGLAETHTSVREPFPPGSLLLMYTDGLVERRRASLDEGLGRMAAAAAAAAGERPEEVARRVIRAMRPGAHADDVALLVLAADAVGERLRVALPADPMSLAAARAQLRGWLEGRLPPEEAYDVVLACSEACANAVEHAYARPGGGFEVEADVHAGLLTVVVRDRGRWRPERVSDRGRGTSIMRAAMDEVDVVTGDGGTEVRMRRRVAPGAQPSAEAADRSVASTSVRGTGPTHGDEHPASA